MGGAKNCPETPRQKMISMMYLVLTAMLALNVSAQILNGYALVNDSMKKSITISDGKVESLANEFGNLQHSDSIKALMVKPKIDSVMSASSNMVEYLSGLEERIVRLVNGEGWPYEKDGNGKDILALDPSKHGELNIASQVGLVEKAEGTDKINGVVLEEKMKEFREIMSSIDTVHASAIMQTFNTDAKKPEGGGPEKSWYCGVFEEMPAIATLAVLNKIKNDVKIAESEALAYLIGSMDAGDFRVNKIEAIPVTKTAYVMKGGTYSADIILAATDTTKKPVVKINGTELEGNHYELKPQKLGPNKYDIELLLTKKNGEVNRFTAVGEYMVGEPTATVSADLMNVLYAGFDNPISVSVPGVAQSDITINVSNCKSQGKTGKGWNIKPAKVGEPCKIRVNANIDGKSTFIAEKVFRVKKLPDPLAMLEVKGAQGGTDLFKGGKAIAKNVLITANRVVAKLDDADLNVNYRVLEFSLNYFDSMGNTLVEKASGPNLTDRQKKVFREMTKAKTVYVTNTIAIGQDNLKRTLPPVEIKIK